MIRQIIKILGMGILCAAAGVFAVAIYNTCTNKNLSNVDEEDII